MIWWRKFTSEHCEGRLNSSDESCSTVGSIQFAWVYMLAKLTLSLQSAHSSLEHNWRKVQIFDTLCVRVPVCHSRPSPCTWSPPPRTVYYIVNGSPGHLLRVVIWPPYTLCTLRLSRVLLCPFCVTTRQACWHFISDRVYAVLHGFYCLHASLEDCPSKRLHNLLNTSLKVGGILWSLPHIKRSNTSWQFARSCKIILSNTIQCTRTGRFETIESM